MADETTVYNIPGTAPSGAANALFDIFKEERAMKAKRAEADITKDIDLFRSGLKMKEQEQGHGFATALEKMREEATRKLAQEAFERDKMFATEKAQAEATAVGGAAEMFQPQTGQFPIGVPFEAPPPEAGGVPPRAIVPPFGAGVYKDLVGKSITDLLERKKREEELLTRDEAASARTMAQRLEDLDKDSAYPVRLRSFLPGISKRADYEKAMEEAAKETERIRNRGIWYEKLRESREDIAKISAEARKAVANARASNAVSAFQFRTLQGHEQAINRRLSRLNDDRRSIIDRMGTGYNTPAETARAKEVLDAIQEQSLGLQAELVEIGAQIARYTSGPGSRVDVKNTLDRIVQGVIADKYPKKTEATLTPAESEAVIKEAWRRFYEQNPTAPKNLHEGPKP